MSPNEDQLRAALREGEGDAPDAGVIIADATRARYERRRTITSIASGAAVIAVVVTGFGLLAHVGGGESGGAGSADQNAAQGQVTHGGNPRVPTSLVQRAASPPGTHHADAAGAAAAAALVCSARMPRLLVPGGGGIGRFGSDGPLFAQPVAAAKVCAYGPARALAGSTVLTGPAATELAATLASGSASTTPRCPTSSGDEGDVAVYAVTASGQQLRVVTVDLGCPYQATNGTAVRYLTPGLVATLPPTSPSPNQGSPVK